MKIELVFIPSKIASECLLIHLPPNLPSNANTLFLFFFLLTVFCQSFLYQSLVPKKKEKKKRPIAYDTDQIFLCCQESRVGKKRTIQRLQGPRQPPRMSVRTRTDVSTRCGLSHSTAPVSEQ